MESGICLAIFVSSLLVSAWNAAMPFEIKDVFRHAMVAYYLLLLMAHHSMVRFNKSWNRHFLPKATLKNMLFVAVHAILACVHWPSNLPWRPRARNEACAEHHFGSIKSYFRGAPTVKDAILGTQNTHGKQLRDGPRFRSGPARGKQVTPLTSEEAETLSQTCVQQACHFMSWICIDKDLVCRCMQCFFERSHLQIKHCI